jgi:threonine dehydratase
VTGVPTPFEPAPPGLESFAGRGDLWLKREDAHELGAFKWRSTAPVVHQLAARGHPAVVAASTGNHGAAVAWACRRAGVRAVVFLPPGATPGKVALLERLGADVRVAGGDFDGAKAAALAHAEAEGLPFFEDGAEPLQYEAYEAIGVEIAEQSPTPAAAIVTPVGNGALAAGVGAAIARLVPGALRVGVVAGAMPVMAASFDAGRPVEAAAGETIADGLAVRIPVPLAVDRIRGTVDQMVRVSERSIARALAVCHDAGVPAEPSAAAGLAALRGAEWLPADGPIVLVVTGRNVDPAVLERARHDPASFPGKTRALL